MAGKAFTADDLRAMIAEAVAEAVADLTAPAEVVAVTPKAARKGKRQNATPKAAPKASSARRKRGDKVSEWTVRESWKGQTCSPRMLGTAVQAGVAAAILKRGDKFEVSSALGKAYGLPIIVAD